MSFGDTTLESCGIFSYNSQQPHTCGEEAAGLLQGHRFSRQASQKNNGGQRELSI